MNLIPDSALTCRGVEPLQRPLLGHEPLAGCDGLDNSQVLLEMAGQHYSFEKRQCIPCLAIACPRLGPLGKSVWQFAKSQ